MQRAIFGLSPQNVEHNNGVLSHIPTSPAMYNSEEYKRDKKENECILTPHLMHISTSKIVHFQKGGWHATSSIDTCFESRNIRVRIMLGLSSEDTPQEYGPNARNNYHVWFLTGGCSVSYVRRCITWLAFPEKHCDGEIYSFVTDICSLRESTKTRTSFANPSSAVKSFNSVLRRQR